MAEALIIKGYGGFYTLLDAAGETFVCKTRGKLRKEKGDVLVGDYVRYSLINDEKDDQAIGIIEEILPRRNSLIRPKLANIDGAVLLLSAVSPAPDWLLLDKMLLHTAYNNIKPLICINKIDLLDDKTREETELQAEEYRKAGFTCLLLSAKDDNFVAPLMAELSKGLWFLAGNSGVGKSTLTNLLLGKQAMAVGEIGERIERGRHTTRHIEIIPLAEGLLWADTPGFSLLELPEQIDEYMLASYYPEFIPIKGCRFEGCLHFKEPDCAVKAAVRAGNIGRQRFLRYKMLLEIIKEREVKY